MACSSNAWRARTGPGIAALLLTVAGADRAIVLDDYPLSDGTVPAKSWSLPEMMHGLLLNLESAPNVVGSMLKASGCWTG